MFEMYRHSRCNSKDNKCLPRMAGAVQQYHFRPRSKVMRRRSTYTKLRRSLQIHKRPRAVLCLSRWCPCNGRRRVRLLLRATQRCPMACICLTITRRTCKQAPKSAGNNPFCQTLSQRQMFRWRHQLHHNRLSLGVSRLRGYFMRIETHQWVVGMSHLAMPISCRSEMIWSQILQLMRSRTPAKLKHNRLAAFLRQVPAVRHEPLHSKLFANGRERLNKITWRCRMNGSSA